MIYLYNIILLGHKKEVSIDMCYKDESGKHYPKWKEANHKKPHIGCSLMSRTGQSIKTEHRWVAMGWTGEGKRGVPT